MLKLIASSLSHIIKEVTIFRLFSVPWVIAKNKTRDVGKVIYQTNENLIK